MIADPVFPIVALVTGALASVVWTVVFARSSFAWHRGQEHRWSQVLMSGTALLASLGAFASAIGFAVQNGMIVTDVPMEMISLMSSVGRGGLLMAGLIVVTHYRPPKEG